MTDILFSTDAASVKIYRHSGFSATIDDSFSSPSTSAYGVAWDETNVLSVDYTSDKIYRHSGFSTTISDSFSSPSTTPSKIVFDGANIITGDDDANKIYRHSGFSATISDSFSSPSDSPSGIAWDETNMISADYTSDKIYRHSGFSSDISDSFSSPYNDPSGVAWDGTNMLGMSSLNDKIYLHSGFSITIDSSFASPSTTPGGLDWYEVSYNNVKLSDGGANTLDFSVDSYAEEDVDYDVYSRSTNATLKHYEVAKKKRFVLGVHNMADADKDTLKTIYDLRTSLRFYRHASDMTRTALVIWQGGFNLHTPTNQSPQFLEKICTGTITLEEI